MLTALGIIGGIILVDLALSGDNALVIGAAAATLPPEQRRTALVLGGLGAILLRILLTVGAVFLLEVPLLQAIGGVILFAIAARLLAERYSVRGEQKRASREVQERRLLGALLTIVVADVTMSLDNVLANAAIASGHILLLVIGLLLSIGVVLAGSALVAALMGRLPWLLDVAALVLGWVGAGMIVEDSRIGPLLPQVPYLQAIAIAIGLALVLVIDVFIRARAVRHRRRLAAEVEQTAEPEDDAAPAETRSR